MADTSLAEGLRQCAAITDTEKRTACYDALATTAQGPAGFGRDSSTLDSIEAKVTAYSFTPFGKFVVVLDNGQIWQQSEGDPDRAHLTGASNTVSISRGAFGSYAATINDGHHQFKVTRVR
ncbi:MAG TPA: hypothetical protein VGF56_11055 [Rhizomicrobium sp.]